MKVIDNFPIPTSSRLDVKIILQHLKIYARGQVNDTVEHHNLSKRQQQTGERFEDFLASVRDLSKTCTFCEPCTELILRDKIVTCCFDVELRRKLLRFSSENALTLEKAVSIARADEATNLHEQEFESSSHGHAYANRLQNSRRVQVACTRADALPARTANLENMLRARPANTAAAHHIVNEHIVQQ